MRHSRNFYPELDRIKPVAKEYSKLKDEFLRHVLKYDTSKGLDIKNSIPKNKLRMLINPKPPIATALATKLTVRQSLIEKGLPTEIKIFLENSKGRYPVITLHNGSIYVGEMAR